MSHEVWKEIENYPDYEISSHGRVKSFKIDSLHGNILSATNSKGWYLSVGLCNANGRKLHRIHQLVAAAFISKIMNTETIIEIDHIDGDKQNNHVDNLRYLTKKQHHKKTLYENKDMVKGMIRYNQIERPKKILQCDLGGNLICEFNNAKDAERNTGVCSRNILQVAAKTPFNKKKNLVRKTAGGFKWKFKTDTL